MKQVAFHAQAFDQSTDWASRDQSSCISPEPYQHHLSCGLPSHSKSTNLYHERRPGICGGVLVIKGTRVPVRTLLASLMEGDSVTEILTDFPTVSENAMQAVIAFAAAAAIDNLPVPAM